ncbi:PREDICTED: piggyBac transposable element-derived protein 4-like [Eufriesea mexicana]|uniref:piggyBac transposable element-derived protein 4-like n=1 Tax=Eufriesea mexicana TaxID=516756 RepID=UPI00083C53CC|nr:PREDICTED: piggyBac transposable element-derived protein 4-like [Eufriesea mexicana]
MFSRKRFCDEDSENCAINFANESDSSDEICKFRRKYRRIIVDDTSDDDQLPESWVWNERRNSPKIWDYTMTPGISEAALCQLGGSRGEFDTFNLTFDDIFWNNIVTETNQYANQLRENPHTRRKIDETWFPVDSTEIKRYFALTIIMAQIKKPRIQMNWSKRAVIETPIFRKSMPLKRYLQITRFLHFSNNNLVANTDKLKKVRPVINFLNQKFKELYIMRKDISIDESLMKFRGRLSYKQFNPSKRARFGVKFYKLCESDSGYCYEFKIYTGNDKINCKDSASESVVKELSESVLHRGHTLYIDSWYSSPKLFMILSHKYKTNVIGTVRSNRKNMPKDLCSVKLKRGEYVIRSCNRVLALKWRDKRDVYMMSTKHETAEMTSQGSKRTLKPNCITEYNKGMNGIDLQDQILACFPIMRKYMKGYKKIFFYLFDIGLFNSYILWKKLNDGKKQCYVDYKINIAESLLKKMPKPIYKERGVLSSGDAPDRLCAKEWAHFPKHIDPTPSKLRPSKRCTVCHKNKKRKETTWECKKCKVPLHVPECFERYHTVTDY